LLEMAETWQVPVFPLRGDDVTALGIAPGPQVGRLLDAVRRWWEDGDFAARREECLARLKQLTGSASAPC
jgi:tRNA nucleotidyltransferase/poly(A) polymerase